MVLQSALAIEIEEESMLATRKAIFKYFTIVELLAVLAIVGILLAASLASFPMIFGKQGMVSSVRTLSSKVSTARSCAVTQNRYVALLMPDVTTNTTSGTSDVAKYLFNYSRLCYVTYDTTTSTYNFDSWIDGQEWTKLANGVCAYIEPAAGYSIGSILNIKELPSSPAYYSSAIIFQTNGSILTANSVAIRVIPAVFNPGDANYTPTVDAGMIIQKRWSITINTFTGRAAYLYGQ